MEINNEDQVTTDSTSSLTNVTEMSIIQNLQTCMLCFFSWVTTRRVIALQSWLQVYYSYIHYKINSDYDKYYHTAGYVCEVLMCVNSMRLLLLACRYYFHSYAYSYLHFNSVIATRVILSCPVSFYKYFKRVDFRFCLSAMRDPKGPSALAS